MEPKTIIIPTVHMNGTGKRALLDECLEARRAIQEAIKLLPHPNGRDYYPQQNDALGRAAKEARERIEKLHGVADELMSMALAIQNAGNNGPDANGQLTTTVEQH